MRLEKRKKKGKDALLFAMISQRAGRVINTSSRLPPWRLIVTVHPSPVRQIDYYRELSLDRVMLLAVTIPVTTPRIDT